jgi:2-polyprenyl-3-methyl-5-hydroxy-6-metoxy-1,4-benzoquinol methylase
MKVTRGHGILEGFLARKRAEKADELISDHLRTGTILDIGCGTHPYFLLNADFYRKHGLDKISSGGNGICSQQNAVTITNFDIERDVELPYADDSFEVVTMLAVIEHVEPVKLTNILADIQRVLKKGGEYIITTPAFWTDGLLRMLAGIHVLSREEIDEHKDTYSHNKLIRLLTSAGFEKSNIECGYFESFMNLWVKVTK